MRHSIFCAWAWLALMGPAVAEELPAASEPIDHLSSDPAATIVQPGEYAPSVSYYAAPQRAGGVSSGGPVNAQAWAIDDATFDPETAEGWRAETQAGPLTIKPGNFARAAVILDSTRLGSSGGSFVPSTIPVEGQQYFGSDARSLIQGSASSFTLAASAPTYGDDRVVAYTSLQVEDLVFRSESTEGQANVALQQAYVRTSTFFGGISESAFANPKALPDVLDLAGPSARVTVFNGGTGSGQARMSYAPISSAEIAPGNTSVFSVENPVPEIRSATSLGAVSGTNTSTFAHFPDLVATFGYREGTGSGKTYVEDWQWQVGGIMRSLGLENDSQSFDDATLGWGISVTGAYYLPRNPYTCQRDGLFGSLTFGEGISHYIVDLQTASNNLRTSGNDAMIDANNELVALPALAWYAGYTHNWSNSLRSTVTYSYVTLDSIVPTGLTLSPLSPYRHGDHTTVNLVHHRRLPTYDVSTGIEYLYGHKETLDDSTGDGHRLMWVVVFSSK